MNVNSLISNLWTVWVVQLFRNVKIHTLNGEISNSNRNYILIILLLCEITSCLSLLPPLLFLLILLFSLFLFLSNCGGYKAPYFDFLIPPSPMICSQENIHYDLPLLYYHSQSMHPAICFCLFVCLAYWMMHNGLRAWGWRTHILSMLTVQRLNRQWITVCVKCRCRGMHKILQESRAEGNAHLPSS